MPTPSIDGRAPRSRRTVEDWLAALPDLKRRGREYVGPCPHCAGNDRFHVRESHRDGLALVGCRQCNDYGAIARAAFPDEGQPYSPSPFPRRQVPPASKPKGRQPSDEARTAYAGRIWTAAREIPLDADHPARRWLAARNLWWPELPVPPMVRHIARLPAEGREEAGYRPQLHGAVVGMVARPTDWLAAWPELPDPQAVHCVFVDKRGEPIRGDNGRAWKLTYGPSKGAAILIGSPSPVYGLGMSEGLADGLALAARRWETVLCTLTTPRAASAAAEYAAASGGRVFLHLDNDGAGRKSGVGLLAELRSRGVRATASIPPHGYKDAAEYAADNPLPELTGVRQDMEALTESWELAGVNPAWENLRIAARCLLDNTKGDGQ